MNYTVTKQNDDGSVAVTFDSTTITIPTDRKTQNLAGITTKEQLDQYARDFEAGLVQEQAVQTTPTDSDLTALVGKKQTVASDGGAV